VSRAAGARAVADPDYLDLSLADYLDQVAAATPAPGAGAVAATTVALAAGLAAMAAGLSGRQLPDADGLASRMRELLARSKPLAQRDAAAYGEVLAALRSGPPTPERSAAVGQALSRAADVPLEIATIGVAVLDVATDVVRRGNPNLRGDALTACLLAQAAVRAATALVALNVPDATDPRRVRAAVLDEAAGSTPVPLDAALGEAIP
jgi:formiminotetrahydrofolate cyclodeaminase